MSGAAAKLVRNSRTRAQWAGAISKCWQKSVESVFATGRELMAAKAELEHGEFEAMIENDLPFVARTAQRLMKVARDERLSNTTHASLLPSSWMTLYELTKLPDDKLKSAISSGAIHPKMERKEVSVLLGKPAHPRLQRSSQKATEQTAAAPEMRNTEIETPTPSKNVPPVDGCVMFVRRIVFEAIKTMTSEERVVLFSELRAEIDDLEAKSVD